MRVPFLASRPGGRLAAVAGVAAVLLAGALITASQLGDDPQEARPPAAPPSGLFARVAQEGTALGSPLAPVTLVEFADLQCPYCARFALGTLPTLVREYVRTGRLKIVFSGMAFIGPESETALLAATAASRHNRLWNIADALYRSQGTENGGWVTDELLTRTFVEVGLDADRLRAEMASVEVEDAIEAAARLAEREGVRSTPSFLVGRTGSALSPFPVRTLEPAPFRKAIDGLLRA